MAKFEFSYDADRVTIVDSKSKKVDDKLDLLGHVALSEAFRVLTTGRKADAKASDVAISMLADVLESPLLDEYRGKSKVTDKVDSRFLAAVRDIENSVFKSAFVDAHMAKGATAGKADQLWQDFRKMELSTGSYSNAKSMVAKLWCHVGAGLKAPNDKLLPLHAVRRMYESWKAEQETDTGAKTLSDKIVALSGVLKNNTDSDNIGDLPSAIAALKYMLATCETMERVHAETATGNQAGATSPDVSKMAQAATRQAQKGRKQKEQPLTGDALMQALKEAEAAL